MSLSQPTVKNPATRFMQWKGGEEGGGVVTWYDKETNENREVKLPMRFTVLDELNTITGYSKPLQSGFWSNEVKNLMTNDLVVRNKNGVVAHGKYSDIKDEIKAKGAKYAKSVYIAFKDETGELMIGNLKLSGASLTAWIEFQKKFDVTQCAVMITDSPKKEKNGATNYFVPVFEGIALGAETKNAAIELDKELQRYLSSYLNNPLDTGIETVEVDVEIKDVDEDVDEPEQEEEKTDKDKLDLKDIPF